MPLPRRGWAVLVLLLLPLAGAGCLEPAAEPQGPPGAETPTPHWEDPTQTPLSQRAHAHDLWGDATSVTLFEGSVPLYVAHNHLFDEPPREQHTHGCDETLTSDSQGGTVKFGLPPPTTVYPGTRTIDFTFAWTDPSVMGVRFLYRAANAHEFADAGRVTNRQPLRVGITPEMTDDGHATSSHWAFFLCADSDQPLDLAQGNARALVVAFRADEIPLEPAHPPVWHGPGRHVLAESSWSGESRGALNKGDGTFHQLPILERRLVPWDAREILVNVTLRPDPDLPLSPPVDVLLYWRDPTVPEWVYRTIDARPDGGGNLTARIPVDEGMADSVYATASNWDFWLRLTSHDRTEAPSGLGTWSVPHRYVGGFDSRVTVFR